jgi:hypothetical protein
MTYKGARLSSVTVTDVAMADYPDFCDAYVEEAYLPSEERWLTEHELEADELSEQVGEYIHENLDLYR